MTTHSAVQDVAERELGRFLALAAASGDGQAFLMPKCRVDEHWHQLLADPEAYRVFCERVAGGHVEHVKNGGVDRLPWVSLYHARHGALPRVWFENDADFAAYQRTGEVIASWDCNPSVQRKRERQTPSKPAAQPSTATGGRVDALGIGVWGY